MPPVVQPIGWQAVKDALADWITTVIPGIGLRWGGQDAPRPSYPYAQLVMSGTTKVHHDSQHVLGDGLDVRLVTRGDRRVMLDLEIIQSFEDDDYDHDNDAHAMAEALLASLEREEYRRPLREAGIGVWDVAGPIQDRTTGLDAGYLSRAGAELVLGLASVWDPGTSEGAIETVEATATLGADQGDVVRELELGEAPEVMRHYGQLVLDSAVVANVVTPGTFVPTAGTWRLVAPAVDFEHNAGALRYTGEITKPFAVDVNLAMEPGLASLMQLALFKNGVQVDTGLRTTSHIPAGGAPDEMTLHAIVELATNDQLTLGLTADQAVAVLVSTATIRAIS